MINQIFKTLFFLLIATSFITAGDKEKASNFSLKDFNGKEYSLNDFKDSKAIVLIFVSTRCPISNAYNNRMAKLNSDFKDKDVSFIGINSNKQEDVDEIKNHALENNLDFAILKDNNNIVADKFEAKFTPEVFVLNPDFEIVYHGRIDDSRDESGVEKEDLKTTLNEILGGKEVSNPETKAFGCSIKRVDK
jgi:peroxiredoxin